MFETRRSVALAGMLAGACILQLAVSGAPAAAQSPAPTPLAGAVNAPSGEPLAGVAVSARAEGASITTSVFTDEAGRYYFPALEPPFEGGPYRVWAQAVGYERANADVVLRPRAAGGAGFHPRGRRRLHPPVVRRGMAECAARRHARRPPHEGSFPRHVHGMPPGRPPCCRTASTSAAGAPWIDMMANVSYHGWRGSNSRPSITIEYYRNELAAYLTKARGPDSPPLEFELDARPAGEAARHVVTEVRHTHRRAADGTHVDRRQRLVGRHSFGDARRRRHARRGRRRRRQRLDHRLGAERLPDARQDRSADGPGHRIQGDGARRQAGAPLARHHEGARRHAVVRHAGQPRAAWTRGRRPSSSTRRRGRCASAGACRRTAGATSGSATATAP